MLQQLNPSTSLTAPAMEPYLSCSSSNGNPSPSCSYRLSNYTRAQGWIFLVLGFSMFSGFLYAAIISKFLPISENHIVAAIQKDRMLPKQRFLCRQHSRSLIRINVY